MKRLIEWMLWPMRLSIGGGGGGDGGAAEMRQREADRQRRVREGTDLVEAAFASYFGRQPEYLPNPEWVQANAPPPAPVAPRVQATNGMDPRNPRKYAAAGPATDPRQPAVASSARGFSMFPAPYIPKQIVRFNQVAPENEYFEKAEQDYLDYYEPQFDRQADDAWKKLIISLSRSGNLSGSVGAQKQADFRLEKEQNRQRLTDEAKKYGMGIRADIEQTKGNLRSQLEAGSGVENIAAQATAAARNLTAPPTFSPLGELFKNYSGQLATATMATQDSRFPNAEEQRRALLFNIPSPASGSRASTMVRS